MDGVMPKIIKIQPEPHVTWSIEGTILTIGEEDEVLIIDLAEREGDDEIVVDVTRGPDGLAEGIHGPYVLSAEIQPRKYREEVSSSESAGGIGAPEATRVPEPLDIASVVLTLWTTEIENTLENAEEEI
jgi:hypothetical protein